MESKYWMFTINKRDDDEYGDEFAQIHPPDMVPEDYDYLVYQLELESNLHYQGYICLTRKKKKSALCNQYPGVHWGDKHGRPRMGTHTEAKLYCMKRDSTYLLGPWEYGCDDEIPEGKGERRDLTEVFKMIDGGASDLDVVSQHAGSWTRYHKSFTLYRQLKKQNHSSKEFNDYYKNLTYWPFQQYLLDRLKSQDTRKITWVYDPSGGAGKSWLAKIMIAKGEDVFVLTGGKHSDTAYEYNYQKLIIFDYAREFTAKDDGNFVNYSQIENYKEGSVFSGKYESLHKRTINVKVMCLSNHMPDQSKLSSNRWDIIDYNVWIRKNTINQIVPETRLRPLLPRTEITDNSQITHWEPEMIDLDFD